jgi:hypothetical protein
VSAKERDDAPERRQEQVGPVDTNPQMVIYRGLVAVGLQSTLAMAASIASIQLASTATTGMTVLSLKNGP